MEGGMGKSKMFAKTYPIKKSGMFSEVNIFYLTARYVFLNLKQKGSAYNLSLLKKVGLYLLFLTMYLSQQVPSLDSPDHHKIEISGKIFNCLVI